MTVLPSFVLKGKSLLPIVQGGMGVGVSAHRLAGAVARLGGVGTLSSVDLRRHHPDLMAATGKSRDRAAIRQANLVALDREIRAALAGAQGRGLVAVNVMRAVSQYAEYVRQSCESGAQRATSTSSWRKRERLGRSSTVARRSAAFERARA